MSQPETTRAPDETPRARKTTKVAVVGAGAVGSTMAYAALMRGSARHVALYDINRAKVEAEALDLSHGIQFMPMAEVVGSDDVAVCADADIIMVTAGAKQKPGQTRLDLAEATISLVSKILPELLAVAPDATYVMVTNPVDIVTYAALKISGLPPTQLFGSGTVLDSSRLRFLIAQHCGVAVQNVHAYMAGEHGDSEIPLWSSATIGGVPLLEWDAIEGRAPLTAEVRDQIAHEVINSAYRIIEGKGATNYAVALAGSRIIEAVLNDEHRVLPVSTLLDDYYGISDICLSVPSIVGRHGVTDRLQVPLSPVEIRGLQHSAASLKEVARRFGV
ncbi:malate dehydrogenase (NAD) [Sanguibacter keddieii DSM 10542]|uniref:L-lactate dehydrogenase n=1 Tax=Sanguibacter keddieii (strain ATCC 51767 / DSM 10542 / NCFB 3025 / ST-74) TaxID=446469 RepID=D1BJ26_SANKS|nr:L-lactate dehydrogenase [Sanguibacter keddieii]ACZ22220.1 malate dehydrogenase (NAD) [Sanguibacter keddieii DSM 10542]